MAFLRCFECNGKKKIAPLGFMQKECPSCNGNGYIVKLVDNENKLSSESILSDSNDKAIKRRGRPPKEGYL